MMNSCIMLGCTLYTGVDFMAAFKSEDLIDPGVERDSHLTVLYSEGQEIPRERLPEIMETILGESDWENLISEFKAQTPKPVTEYFSLGVFPGEDKDFLVLVLQPDTPLYDTLQILHTGLKGHYGVSTKFPEYKPHMTLATFESGKAKDYVFNPTLGLILEKATFTLDDFIISYGLPDEPGDRKRYQVTTENAVSRFFRLLRAEKEAEYYNNL